jgi:hypothetical protein
MFGLAGEGVVSAYMAVMVWLPTARVESGMLVALPPLTASVSKGVGPSERDTQEKNS